VSELDDFYVHTVTVETLTGTDGYGREIFAAPVILTPPDTGVFVEQKRRMVRAANGAEVISESSVYGRPEAASLFLPGSRVTYRGATSHVLTVALNDSGALDLPDHIQVALT